MADVRLTPQELRNFAKHLKDTAQAIKDKKSVTDRRFHELHNKWRDARYESFKKTFAQAEKGIDEFLKQAEAFSAYLSRKAARADDYRRRGGY